MSEDFMLETGDTMNNRRLLEPKEGVHLEWYELAKEVTEETLAEFVRHLMHDYEHDPQSQGHAVAACVLATAIVGTKIQGRTIGLVDTVADVFISRWVYPENQAGWILRNYDQMLLWFCSIEFEKRINKDTWEALQKEAAVRLPDSSDVDPREVEHLQSIVDGIVPFGYTVDKE